MVFDFISYNFLVHVYLSTDGSPALVESFPCSSFSVKVGEMAPCGSADGSRAKQPVERGYVCARATGRWWVGAG